MAEPQLEVGASIALPKIGLDQMLANLRQNGYQLIGPRIQDNTVVYSRVDSMADLPRGFLSDQDAGKYQLNYTGHDHYFDITPGPHSWKQVFFPPIQTIQVTDQKPNQNKKWVNRQADDQTVQYALIGVRPCELAAIEIQDQVFLRREWSDPVYNARRQSAFIVAVNCVRPCGTCFCASMGTGPKAERGFDLCLTELDDVFLVEVGSDAGRLALSGIKWNVAGAFYLQTAQIRIDEARQNMGRQMPDPNSLPELLLNNLEASRWNEVAKRCLSCTNCTQVCPTCFCWDIRDSLSLSGETAKRERIWDSCFNPDYSYVFGGNTRPNTRSRYRQWMTHKLGSWHYQFGLSGCVGCGRCITWCPAAIDITAEVAAIREEVGQ